MLCNREIKFGVGLDLGAATGRHALRHRSLRARADREADGAALHKARDAAKDQSYFLHAVGRQSNSHGSLMPLGELKKAQVRERARSAGLPVFDKPDSTGICFIGERPFREFLGRFLARDARVRSSPPTASRSGRHQGLAFYTLGQRGGLHIGGRRGRPEQPWYVAAKDATPQRPHRRAGP